jgi:hypothetical protein
MMSKESSNIKNKDVKGTGSISTLHLSKFKLLLLIITIIFAVISLYPVQVLYARDMWTKDQLKSWLVPKDATFSIKYIHSVERTPVWETYSLNDDEIILEETIFQSYGAGLPATSPYDFDIVEDGFRLYDINQVMTNLIYRTGAVRANHELLIGDKSYPFLDFSKPTQGVKFETQKMTFIFYLTREGLY